MVLAVGFLVMALGFGLRNTFSVFYPEIVEDFGWSRGGTAAMFSLNILVYGLLSPVVGGLVDRLKPQLLLSLGIAVIGGGTVLCGFATSEWHFYLLYGILVAVGAALAGVTPLATIVTPWFTRNRGLVFSILASGFGVSLVSASLVQYLISTYGWRNAYFITGLAVVALLVPLTLLIVRRAPAVEHDEATLEATEQPSGVPQEGHSQWQHGDWSLSKTVKTPQFWMLWLVGFLQIGIAEKIAIAHQVYFFRDVGYGPMNAAMFYSVFGVFFVLGTLGSSVSDRVGREKIFLPACGLSIASVALLFVIQDAAHPWMANLFAACFGVGLGAMPPVLFASVSDLFHGKSYGAILGMMVLGISLGGAVSPWLAGYMHDVTGNYTSSLFLLLAALVVCGLLFSLVAPRKLNPVRANRAD
ncbi:MFS transporter [Chloroflexota bacterium]